MGSNILTGDCFELIKDIPDNSIDLIVTSPPYADIVNYGKNISIQKPQDYCDWLLPIFNEIQRVLKPSGSFILNINDNCSGGYRNPFIYELIYRSQKENKLKFYDTYIWHKMNGIPNGGTKRFRNTTEFIFHFVKDQKNLKFNMDRVLIPTNEQTLNRHNRGGLMKCQGIIKDGERIKEGRKKEVAEFTRPDNVVRFSTAGAARDNTIKHPAPFYKDLPKYYINLLTDDGDTILDPFGGIMTTGLACKEIGNRNFIGMELNEKYAEFGKKRIDGEELKAEEYVINQYDEEGNFIQSFRTIGQAEKKLNIDSHNHIEDCIRKGNKSAYGYKWKLEKNNYGKI